MLRTIAQGSGGTLTQLRGTDTKPVYKALGSRVGRTKKNVEVTAAAAGAGLVLMLGGALLSGRLVQEAPV